MSSYTYSTGGLTRCKHSGNDSSSHILKLEWHRVWDGGGAAPGRPCRRNCCLICVTRRDDAGVFIVGCVTRLDIQQRYKVGE